MQSQAVIGRLALHICFVYNYDSYHVLCTTNKSPAFNKMLGHIVASNNIYCRRLSLVP